ncbi:MAG: ABC transporter permease [Parvularculaceae bacterium]
MFRILSILDRKLARDLWRIRGQAAAIALVIASGVSLFIMTDGMLTSLEETTRAYYERHRFADVFAPLKRAPDRIVDRLREIPGVADVQGRVMAPLLANIEGASAPISGVATSLDMDNGRRMNDVYISAGRMIDPTRPDEILLLESFADAHGLRPGDSISVTINGAREDFEIVGLALSPEYIYTIPAGELVPNDARFAVIWMERDALAAAFDLDGAFNNAVAILTRTASIDAVIDALDNALKPYGATGAYSRDDQLSNKFLTEELKQLSTMGRILPPIFLGVAAFLLNIVIARMIEAEREEIGLMKAFGHTNKTIGAHYLKFVFVIAVAGAALGTLFGLYLGNWIAGMYQSFYKFPFLIFSAHTNTFATVFAVSIGAAAVGALASVYRAVRLTPAEAMRPPAPPDFSHGAAFAKGLARRFDEPTRMVIRRLVRQPVRAGLTTLGVAAAMALAVTMRFNNDAIDFMIDASFNVIDRYDVLVNFTEPVSRKALFEIEAIDGVIAVEPARSVPVRMKNGASEHLGAITGLQTDPRLSRPVDNRLRSVAIREDGVVMGEKLAEILNVSPGGEVTFEVLEGRQPTLVLPVIATTRTLIGTPAFLEIGALNRAMGDSDVVDGAYLRIDATRRDEVYAALKDLPRAAGVSLHREAQIAFQKMVDEGPGVFRYIMTIFSIVIAAGVVYNAARIALAERARDLASLRVLGFTKAETSYVLLGEIAVISLAALPVGAVLGYLLSAYIASAFSTELYQIPHILHPNSYGYAAVVIVVSAIISGLLVYRDVDKLDLVSALKTRD